MKSSARRKGSSASSGTSSGPKYRYKLHRRGDELVLAACDAALIGGSWKEGKLRLSVPETFYSELTCEDVRLLLNLAAACTQANLVGKEVVAAFVDAGLVDEEAVITIGGVAHAIFVRME